MRTEVFLDSGFAIALSSPNDRFHDRALELADELQRHQTRLVTTQAILLEIGNALSRKRYRKAAVDLLEALQEDPNVDVMPLSDRVFEHALRLYRERSDKEWGLTDCISFTVMHERSVTEALTPDHHFQQAGFRALLAEPGESP